MSEWANASQLRSFAASQLKKSRIWKSKWYKAAVVKIQLFDAQGRLVRTLDLGSKPAGQYFTKDKAAYWDGRNDQSERVASGTYFYYLQAGHFRATRKMLVGK